MTACHIYVQLDIKLRKIDYDLTELETNIDWQVSGRPQRMCVQTLFLSDLVWFTSKQ